MGNMGGFYKGEKKKLSAKNMEKKAKKMTISQPMEFPEVIKKNRDSK